VPWQHGPIKLKVSKGPSAFGWVCRGGAAVPCPAGRKWMTKWDKSKLPSRHTTVGPDRAPHRSYYYAMGLTEAEIDQPFVGVATCWNEAAPCNIDLSRQAQSVKKGVKEAEGTP